MKAIKRKLLSLLLAMAMVCSLVPTALAAGGGTGDDDEPVTPPAPVELTGVNVSGAGTTAKVDESYTLTASPVPAGAEGVTYTWEIVTGGNAINISSGTGSSITVTCKDKSSTTNVEGSVKCSAKQGDKDAISETVSVTFVGISTTTPVTGVTITEGTSKTMDANSSLTLHATVQPSTATEQGVTWNSSDSSVATVNSSTGVVNSKAKGGTVDITATSVGLKADGTHASATCTITVNPPTVEPSITLTADANTVELGSTLGLTVTTANAPAGHNILWEVGNGESASTITEVTKGSRYIFTPTKEGNNVTITAKLVNASSELLKSASVNVNVTAATKKATLTSNASQIAVNGTATLTIATNYVKGTDYDKITWNIDRTGSIRISEQTDPLKFTVTGDVVGITKISANLMKNNSSIPVATTNQVTIQITNSAVYISTTPTGSSVTSCDLAGYNNQTASQATLYAHVTNPLQGVDYVYSWSLATNGSKYISAPNISTNNTWSQTISALATGQTSITVYAYRTSIASGNLVGYATITINVGYTGSVYATATVSTSTNSYALGDTDDAGKSSIVSQLDSYFYSASSGRYGLSYVIFSSRQDGNNGSLNATVGTPYYADRQGSGSNVRYLSDVLFYPGNVKTTATFPATFYYYTNNYQGAGSLTHVSGSITFNVIEGASTGDITYTASLGEDCSFALRDFEDYYYTKTKGTLNYVSFTLPSGGYLYADSGRLTTNNACYVSPSRTQTDLAGVYFSPTGTTATRASTVRINFTAYGTRASAAGTVVITYLSGSAKDITYPVSTTVSLKASDFTDAYRQVVGSTAPSSLTIQFQNVPTNGTLAYKDSSRSNSTTVTLRSNNVLNYKFTTLSSGSNRLSDVTYTASGNRSDTIDYIAYVNNTPQFTGKVVFNASNTSAANMQVSFTSTNGQSVAFSYAEFSKANTVVMSSCSYIRFLTLPTGGTLTYNGAVMTLSSTNVAPSLLGSVVYRPNAGFNNSTDRISFLCYDASGNSVGGGQVNIVVTGNTSNGASVVSQFTDVSATAWYRDDLITLVNAGIIQGRGDGKFDPTAELTYGEALKIFLLASGYPKQAEASGKDWAINYRKLAADMGWISSSVDLNAKISRNAMAELAARSLGVASSSAGSPWSDGTANGYAVALYYTSPRILNGNDDGTFKGTTTLRRQEICAIAARVMSYKNSQPTDKPGWLA